METRFEFKDFLKVFGLALILLVFFGGILSFVPGLGGFLESLHPSVAFLLEYLIQFVILFCPLWIFVVGKYNARWQDFGLKRIPVGVLLKTVTLSYLCYIGVTLLISLLLELFHLRLPGYEGQESFLPLFGTDVVGLIVGFVLVGLVAPFLEEFFFRGFIYRIFVKTWPLWLGSFLSAVIFALIHMQFQTFIPLFILGLLLNYSYQRTGSLWTPIAFHALNNILVFGVQLYFNLAS